MGKNDLKNNYIGKKIIILTVIIFLLILLLFSYFIIISEKNNDNKANNPRILTASQLRQIKEMYYKGKYYNKDSFYDFVVLDLSGNVLFSNRNNILKNAKVDIEREIGYDNAFDIENKSLVRYSVPLFVENSQKGIVVFYIPYEKVYMDNSKKCFFLIFMLMVIIFLLFKINRFINIDILKPIKEVNKSTKTILKGNYSYKINYDYHGEIGVLCHDFEYMREELKLSKEREKELSIREKELLACISHDLKTPLSSIVGYVEGIRDGIVKDKQGIEKYTSVILRKSKEISKLIDDILEQSKIELNEMSIVKKEIYLDEYLLEVLEDISLDVDKHNMKLIIKGEIPKVLVLIDPFRIQQVINNIVYNSIKYSNINGIIKVFILNDEKDILINIKDYGRGINSEDIPFIFNKFYRGEIHRDTNIPGSGLGLSISKYIIECHGGNIKCMSSIEKGTVISFTIPKL